MRGRGRASAGVLLLATLAAALHLAPFAVGFAATPSGMTFTGNVRSSPDFMQYRDWFRESQRTGIWVRNTFTSEPNPPHLLVPLYFLIGRIAGGTGIAPEFVYICVGALLAFALVVLLGAIVARFVEGARPRWWTLSALVFGGGLGGYFKAADYLRLGDRLPLLEHLVLAPVRPGLLFENYRGHYVISTIFDAHFLAAWIAVLLTILALQATLSRFSWMRAAGTGLLCAAVTALHLYAGITLLAAAGGATIACWRKGLPGRSAFGALAAAALGVGACLLGLFLSYRGGGLPVPAWQGHTILISILFLSYALPWLLVAARLQPFWRSAGLEEALLLGWLAGGTALTLSAPFFPFPARGTLTLQVPLTLIAGMSYFRHRTSVPLAHALVAIVLLGSTPLWIVSNALANGRFRADAPYRHLSQAHRSILTALDNRAGPQDVFLASERDALWIAPTFPGKLYCAHFFLTVDYERKRAELRRFLSLGMEDPASFLRRERIRFVYVAAGEEPAGFAERTGLIAVRRTDAGTLFEVGH